MQADTAARQVPVDLAAQRFISKVYWWMFVALMTTAIVSYYVISTPNMLSTIIQNQMLFIGLIIAELGLVIALSAAINRLSAGVATACFFLYAALTGLTLSVVFIAYTSESIAMTFFITAGTFAVMSFYGYVTKRDLTSMGNLAFMGLVGIIIASLANWFIKSSALGMGIAYIGVLVFVGLTAYDTQKIKKMGAFFKEDTSEERKGAIMGALQLYLDFINLFLLFLRLFGKRR